VNVLEQNAGDRLLVVSADCHAGPEHFTDYAHYMENRWQADFAEYLQTVSTWESARSDARSTKGGAKSRPGDEGLWSSEARLAYLDADGISAEIIFIQGAVPFGPYPAIAVPGVRPAQVQASPAQTAAGCRAYNRWLAQLCDNAPERHIGVAQIPIDDIPAAVAEVELARKSGLRGGVQLPAMTRTDLPAYNHPAYEPLWEVCAALEMPLNLHGGARMFYDPAPEALALVLAEVDWFSRRSLAYLIFSGVFERHRGLNFAVTEQRCHWVAPMLRELDSIADSPRTRSLRERISRKPSEYFATNGYVGASFMSRLECEDRHSIGVHKLMWGSDFPHEEGTWPWTAAALSNTFGGDVPLADIKAMIGGNAINCYRLDEEVLRPIAERVGPGLSLFSQRQPIASYEGAEYSWAFRRSGAWA